MRTVLIETPPLVAEWLEERRVRGLDTYDEVWAGVRHVAPAPSGAHGDLDHQLSRVLGPLADAVDLVGFGPINIGQPDDYRVPDQAFLTVRSSAVFHPTAEIVVEIVSPGDESWEKLEFYAAHGVQEMLIVDPRTKGIQWLHRSGDTMTAVGGSQLLAIDGAGLAQQLEWPTI
ncbi:Uma2 family endonuclease [Euzebya tangerina]|uniref:Uma2 family endonuclease n=1 Tax=Euzebya tangerina TaxID=591198 RepID=UPI000E31FB75|nr:Uma2 family endonuclease [Euzebya tangerina]